LGNGNKDTEALAIPITEDEDDEFFDASADSKPSSRNTIKDAAIFNNAKPASREIQSKEAVNRENANKDDEKKSNIVPIVAAAAAISATVASRSNGNSPISTKDVSDADSLHNITETKQETVSEKVFSKAETDALIASAVATALANAAASQKKSVIDINTDSDNLEDDFKRHTCDMSHINNNNIAPNHDADSAVVSHLSRGDDDDDEEEPVSKEDYGNVIVHLPREEDTITSSPYHEKRQQQRELEDLAILNRHEQASHRIEDESDRQASKSRLLELSMGPSITHEKEPIELNNEATVGIIATGTANNNHENEQEQDEEDEILDIPVRPANPPPAALLSRAALSPTFNERSMSPISVPSSKGKAPYDSYSGISSPTNDDIQPNSRLEFKRGSISASSMSTNNTNEQLQSITSSQYDASGRSTGAGTTDPNTINLITQTMIGDWMYKYTRKAVGGGLSEKRHQRYFWIHPYTNTLYWSTSGPGGNGNGHEAKAKCGKFSAKSSLNSWHLTIFILSSIDRKYYSCT
jgi:hypothetical protein